MKTSKENEKQEEIPAFSVKRRLFVKFVLYNDDKNKYNNSSIYF